VKRKYKAYKFRYFINKRNKKKKKIILPTIFFLDSVSINKENSLKEYFKLDFTESYYLFVLLYIM
jgi:hypothetical protein